MANPTFVNLNVPRFAWDIGGESWQFRADALAFYELEKLHGFTLPFTEIVRMNSLQADHYNLLWAMSATYRQTKNPVISELWEFLTALPVGEEWTRIVRATNNALIQAFDVGAGDSAEAAEEQDAEGNRKPAPSEPEPPTGSS